MLDTNHKIAIKNLNQPSTSSVTCTSCQACCCRLEVMLISDTGVPQHYISQDKWGSETMRRLNDGWCAALDRETMLCTIYEHRPWICREFEMGSVECLEERAELL
ncbi:YkgJ family cysteine cluster protein [Oceanisphaera avium]|uniref:Zinc/iron-chelating domain-containing protein n=1 Tax=Oceanisphaera avium TaxID=1903694 RepID=A0A1Y0CYX7_9GAMM|nr:YkgJ family cysteine cluster protein [Oceanisphaera avium]ART80107.1 zinc/iron-chelating domain-containing protein [Oceanisphaera avium]